MGSRYIGSKTRIVDEIISEIKKLVPNGGIVTDLMCGTGAVAVELRKNGYKVIAVDVMSQACHITKVKVLLQAPPPFSGLENYLVNKGQRLLTEQVGYEAVIQTLNNLPPVKGYFWKEFSVEGNPCNGEESRKYFSTENAQKIDSVREFIQKVRKENKITDIEYSLLIHDLIMASNDIANIAGTYGHYLSKYIPRALQPLRFTPARFEQGGSPNGHKVINGYAEDLANGIEADLCYIDPPYRKRQYAANYHIPETIAKGDEPEAIGKSGLRPWRDQYSDFCSKVKIRKAFEKIIVEMKCKKFLISYNSEGLLSKDDIVDFLSKFGRVKTREFPNKRFKSRNENADENITEYLFYLQKPN